MIESNIYNSGQCKISKMVYEFQILRIDRIQHCLHLDLFSEFFKTLKCNFYFFILQKKS
jgi:hypothetical protein